MILLLGGTAETAALTAVLAAAGWHVLVSTATDAPLELPVHERIERRIGRLDRAGLAALIRERGVRVVVDATHPYAAEAHATARAAAEETGRPCLRWQRRATALEGLPVHEAADHEAAARQACSLGQPVLLTTGSRNLEPYVREARRRGVRLIARILPHPESLAAGARAGLTAADLIAARGPFSLEDNLEIIRKFEIGVLVTKDGGAEGGMPAKLEAARQAGCAVIVVRRPAGETTATYSTLPELLAALPPQK